ncbi:MAG: MliC family protein [Treponemataceae bacterium]
MKRLSLALVAILLVSCSTKNEGLGVKLISTVGYSDENETFIEAQYYTLTDDSLNFVKLFLSDGTEVTLPQAISASGVRYTDDFIYTWWTKGSTASFEQRDAEGNWMTSGQFYEK